MENNYFKPSDDPILGFAKFGRGPPYFQSGLGREARAQNTPKTVQKSCARS